MKKNEMNYDINIYCRGEQFKPLNVESDFYNECKKIYKYNLNEPFIIKSLIIEGCFKSIIEIKNLHIIKKVDNSNSPRGFFNGKMKYKKMRILIEPFYQIEKLFWDFRPSIKQLKEINIINSQLNGLCKLERDIEINTYLKKNKIRTVEFAGYDNGQGDRVKFFYNDKSFYSSSLSPSVNSTSLKDYMILIKRDYSIFDKIDGWIDEIKEYNDHEYDCFKALHTYIFENIRAQKFYYKHSKRRYYMKGDVRTYEFLRDNPELSHKMFLIKAFN